VKNKNKQKSKGGGGVEHWRAVALMFRSKKLNYSLKHTIYGVLLVKQNL
jgi:hypothetical protein